jgi:hypothetical protein
MSDLPPRPPLLMFLHGLTILLIVLTVFGLLGYGLVVNRLVRYGSSVISPVELSIQVVYSIIALVFCFLTARAIGRRSINTITLGLATFFGLGLWNLGFLIYWLIDHGPLSRSGLLVFLGLMIGKVILYLGAAIAFAFSKGIKHYLHPEIAQNGGPPPPPKFSD